MKRYSIDAMKDSYNGRTYYQVFDDQEQRPVAFFDTYEEAVEAVNSRNND